MNQKTRKLIEDELSVLRPQQEKAWEDVLKADEELKPYKNKVDELTAIWCDINSRIRGLEILLK
jgi:hypothetical protein